MQSVYPPNSIENLKVFKGIKKCEHALESTSSTIGDCIKVNGEDWTEAYIEAWIVNVVEFLNQKRSMSDMQIKECAMLIIENYIFKSLNIADINLIFKRAKSGYFGDLYQELNAPKIIIWFNKYWDERTESAALLIQKKESNYFNMPSARNYTMRKADKMVYLESSDFKNAKKKSNEK